MKKKKKNNFLEHLRRNILRGLLSLIPILLVFKVAELTYIAIDKNVMSLIEPLIKVEIPGLGLVVLVIFLYFMGVLINNIFGKSILALFESWVSKIPIVGQTMSVGKQLAESLSPEERKAFDKPVLVPYLKDGQWTVAFICGDIHDEKNKKDLVKCFIPIPPNPATGWVVLVEKDKIRDTGWTNEEAMKAVISLGIVTPEKIKK